MNMTQVARWGSTSEEKIARQPRERRQQQQPNKIIRIISEGTPWIRFAFLAARRTVRWNRDKNVCTTSLAHRVVEATLYGQLLLHLTWDARARALIQIHRPSSHSMVRPQCGNPGMWMTPQKTLHRSLHPYSTCAIYCGKCVRRQFRPSHISYLLHLPSQSHIFHLTLSQ